MKAFPYGYDALSKGMDLRDYFAGQALKMKHVQDYGAMTADDMAKRAYTIADAMLAARTKES